MLQVSVHHWATSVTLYKACKSDPGGEGSREKESRVMSLIIRKHDFQSSDYGNSLFILHITHSLGNYTLRPGGTLRLLKDNFQDIAFKGVM